MGDSYRARFWAPSAFAVAIVGERCHLDLTTEDGQHWEAEILFPPGVHRYRFLVDGTWTVPDPFNARFVIVDGQYYSVFDSAHPAQDKFPETARRMTMTPEVPSHGRAFSERLCFGPAQQRVTAVVQIDGLWRQENHVTWLWESPSGRKLVLYGVASSTHDQLYCAIPYADFREFGAWTVTCFANGRHCGATAFTVKPAVYGKNLSSAFPQLGYRVG